MDGHIGAVAMKTFTYVGANCTGRVKNSNYWTFLGLQSCSLCMHGKGVVGC